MISNIDPALQKGSFNDISFYKYIFKLLNMHVAIKISILHYNRIYWNKLKLKVIQRACDIRRNAPGRQCSNSRNDYITSFDLREYSLIKRG